MFLKLTKIHVCAFHLKLIAGNPPRLTTDIIMYSTGTNHNKKYVNTSLKHSMHPKNITLLQFFKKIEFLKNPNEQN